jgi:signal transduction histidine kinase
VKQVILNLCKNAVEAMPEGGSLTLKGYLSGADTIVVEVSDTGIGIPEGMDIFEIFRTTKPDGTGLGLPLVSQIVSAHRGTVDYFSEPGKGTTFKLTLPVR